MNYQEREAFLREKHEQLIERENQPIEGNGIFERYAFPVLTADHAPLEWRYDFSPADNPFLMERFGIHAVFNSGAIKWNGLYRLVARVEGADRKSFFALADSPTGVDRFRFHERPLTLPEYGEPATNVYDMRLTAHEDGYVYGIFCVERKDPDAPKGDLSAAVACAGVVRTKDFGTWERLPDIKSRTQQRNVVLHPEFVNGKYALYTRPQDGFIDTGNGGGIGWALVDTMDGAVIGEEKIISSRHYHTVMECKNGEGAPEGWEYVGDVMNVLFSNGWIADEDGRVLIYYASSDTRMHVAVSSVDRLVDYCLHTDPDEFRTGLTVERLNRLIDKNLKQR